MKQLILLFAMVGLFSTYSVQAQNRAASPAAKLEQKVGLTDVTIEYSRPSVKDRTIFADDGLVPFGKVWRTGANAATKITFSDDVKIAGNALEAGTYVILTIPRADEWDVHFHKYAEAMWRPYAEKTPALAIKATPEKLDGVNIESFLITVSNLRDYSASLVIAWENTRVSVPFEVN